MSADRTLVFYGMRYEFAPEYLDVIDDGTSDPRVRAAERAGLDVYYANFGGLEERHFLFVGKNLGSIGIEDACDVVINSSELNAVVQGTNERLEAAALDGVPALYVQWQQDM